jgi:hypothetical protein
VVLYIKFLKELKMSERSKLEQVLEFLLAEDNERAEELLHEYVVETARFEYERILDEDEVVESKDEDEDEDEDAVEEAVESDEEEAVEEDFEDVSEIIDEADPEDDMMADVADDEDDEDDHHADVGGDDALEDKVDELEDELEDLRAEFEKLMGDSDADDAEDMDMDAPEMEEESVEYDLDEEVVEEDDDEVVEEATKMSDTVAEPKGGEADSNESPYTNAPKPTAVQNGNTGPVKAKDGGMGDQSASAKDHTPTDNIKVEPKKA